MRAAQPMTDAERSFAEDRHELVLDFLHRKQLPMQDYYDVVVFGFIAAVQEYLNDAELADNLDFEIVAYRCMKDAVAREWEYKSRKKRSGVNLSLDAEIAGTDGATLANVITDLQHDTAMQAEAAVLCSAAKQVATPRELQIFPYLTNDISVLDIANELDISMGAVRSCAYRFRRRARLAIG